MYTRSCDGCTLVSSSRPCGKLTASVAELLRSLGELAYHLTPPMALDSKLSSYGCHEAIMLPRYGSDDATVLTISLVS